VIEELRVPVASEEDIIVARKLGREMAGKLGFSPTEMVLVATAISELARNILAYASRGEIALREKVDLERRAIEVVARDAGPGIPDLKQVMQGGFSTSGGLGLGLTGVRRLMDDFEITSRVGEGTTVVARKWNHLNGTH